MSEPTLSVESVSKLFRIGAHRAEGARYIIERVLRNPLSLFQRTKLEDFWALQDISFKAYPGDVLGVMGRNGAGKSTLLKLISRVSLPTKGRIAFNGRVGSLLEVGTGFHPELTGRENIFLNGALLGMKRAEILKNFDAIVDFAEISQFLDTPVKRYSSGMFVRLGFAIASHLETEILIVDEVLAVGDQKFQKRCVQKLSEVGQSGRTILFVSHNPELVRSFCNRGIYLENGKLSYDGDVNQAVALYQQRGVPSRQRSERGVCLTDIARHPPLRPILQYIRLRRVDGNLSSCFAPGDRIRLEIDGFAPGGIDHANILATFSEQGSSPIFTVFDRHVHDYFEPTSERFTMSCEFDLPSIAPGNYYFSIRMSEDGRACDNIPMAVEVEVAASDFYPSARMPRKQDGPLMVKSSWQLEQK